MEKTKKYQFINLWTFQKKLEWREKREFSKFFKNNKIIF